MDDIRVLLKSLPAADEAARARAEAREPTLTKPAGSLGRLEELACWLAAWQGKHPGTVDAPQCIVFAGNHGVAARGVSAFPPEVTVQMVANYKNNGASINQLCRTNGITLSVVCLDLDRPTEDFTQKPAMSEEDLVAAFKTGVEEALKVASAGGDLLCLGEMGIGNTTSAAAISMALHGGAATDWTGPGTGVQGAALSAKAKVVADGVSLHEPQAVDAIDILRRLGGRELAAIAGAVVGARLSRMVVILDGFICTAAAAPLEAFVAGALDHCIVAHKSQEPGHAKLFARLNKIPLLDLGMRLGEASGATTAVPIVRAAAACHAGMATFDEAGVSDKS